MMRQKRQQMRGPLAATGPSANTVAQSSVLIFHKIESHPLEHAEEKMIQDIEQIHQNWIEPFSYYSGRDHYGPLDVHKKIPYNYERHNQRHSSSMAFNGPVLTTAQAVESIVERRRTPRSIRVPGSCPEGQLPSWHSAIWQELAGPTRPVTIESPFIYPEEPSVTLHYPPNNFDPLLEYIRLEHLVEQHTSAVTLQQYESSLEFHVRVTDQLDLNDGFLPIDAEASAEISRQDGLSSFQQIRPVYVTHDCFVCDEKFWTSEALGNHYRSHLEGALYKCQHCGWGFPSMSSKFKHLHLGKCSGHLASRVRHRTPKSLADCARGGALPQQQEDPPKRICLIQDTEVSRDQSTELAEDNNDGVPIITSVRSLAQLPTTSLIKCPSCTERLSSDHLLQVHLRVHSGDVHCGCNACQDKYTETSLAVRSKSHRRGAHKAFKERRSAHCMNDVISLPEKYEQDLESENIATFDLAGGANDPQGIGQASQTSAGDRQQAQRTSTCPHCFQRFPTGCTLMVDLRNHLGDQPYICTQK